ncbi:cytochrome c nitrite reductase small subunit [candidate division KSB1 bacterium]|nr:cytochrome c nitrite reductase small subunit [candidate division KSB1 bacterium]
MMVKGAKKTPKVALFLGIVVGMLVGLGGYTFWYGRGYSYFSNDPAACVNCHVMCDSFNSWGVSSHRGVTCNDCHIPHSPVLKYAAKLENGIHHSIAFTFEDVQVIRITPRNLQTLQQNCIRCHEPMVSLILQGEQGLAISCTRCHQGAGHVF